MVTKTLISNLTISVPDLAEIFDEGWDEIVEVPEFEKTILYRRYNLAEDNMTGDLIRSDYDEYSTVGEIQLQGIEDKTVKSGILEVGDAEIFLPSRIRRETSGSFIENEFRPQIGDYVVFNDITYKLVKLSFNILGQTELFTKAYGLKMKDDSTVSDVTTVPYVAGEILDLFREYMTTPEFQQEMVYRKFTQTNDPMTGDKVFTNYTDYTIYGTLDVENIENVLLPPGNLKRCDVVIWLDARLKTEVDGTAISPQVRPALWDRIIYNGVTYKINTMTFYIMGTNEIFAKIGGLRMKSDNPVVDWNPSYDSTFKVGGGYS